MRFNWWNERAYTLVVSEPLISQARWRAVFSRARDNKPLYIFFFLFLCVYIVSPDGSSALATQLRWYRSDKITVVREVSLTTMTTWVYIYIHIKMAWMRDEGEEVYSAPSLVLWFLLQSKVQPPAPASRRFCKRGKTEWEKLVCNGWRGIAIKSICHNLR